MVTNTDLYWRYEEADSYAQDPSLDERYARRFAAIERKLEKLWWRDTAEWIAEFYREAYRAKQREERDDPLCTCPNPRCPLKHGGVPYQLRRRETTLDTPERTPMEELKAYLKTHSDAVIIDEALQQLRTLRSEVGDELVSFNRDARRDVDEDSENAPMDDPLVDSVPTDPGVHAPPGVEGD